MTLDGLQTGTFKTMARWATVFVDLLQIPLCRISFALLLSCVVAIDSALGCRIYVTQTLLFSKIRTACCTTMGRAATSIAPCRTALRLGQVPPRTGTRTTWTVLFAFALHAVAL